jgi:Prion-inhibition and propagation
MADIAIGGIGLISLLALFQTCNRAYDVFIRSAKSLGRDAYILGVLMEVERAKLRLWG